MIKMIIDRAFKSIIRTIRNLRRGIKSKKLRWIYLDLDIPLNERPEPRKNFFQKRLFPSKILSLAFLEEYFNRLSKLPKFEGIIIHLRKQPEGLAKTQSLRDLILDFRKTGKKVIVYAHGYDFFKFYVATAADEICLQQAGNLNIIGLQLSRLLMKDALAKRDLSADVVPISPYKSAGDMFSKSSISKEDREQYQAIIDSAFDTFVSDVSLALDKSEKEIIELVNNAPYTAKDSLVKGLVHTIISEEDLIEYVKKEYSKRKKLVLTTWEKSLKKLKIPKPKPAKNTIAVISVEGSIIDGKSKKPPIKLPIPIIGDDQAGDQTIVHLLRKAMRDKKVKAVVFHVNSGGGSVVASEAMRSAIKELVKKKPVVTYFSDVAASGGYYIATSSSWVVSQPMTLTGSIGVINLKFITQESLKKQGINRVFLRRGERAGIYSPEKPFSEEERNIVFKGINEIYDVFLDHVAEFRKMERKEFEEYCGGRVWSGKDAKEIGLVDELGSIKNAIEKAAEIAKLNLDRCRIVDIYKAKPDVPIWYKDGKINFSLEDWMKPFFDTHVWMVLPEEIKIE